MDKKTQRLLNISDRVDVILTCATHGSYPGQTQQVGARVISTPCPTCEAERRAAAEDARRAEIESSRSRARAQRLRDAGIPYYLWQAGFDGFRARSDAQRDALRTARDYAERFDVHVAQGRNLVFCGRVGTGKTHLASAIAISALDSGYSVLMTSAFRLAMRIKESYRSDSDTTTLQAIDRLIDYDLLVVDEVGVQFGSETEKLLLTQVLNGRYEELLPTLLITNLTETQLGDCLGDRLVDRLCDRGSVLVPFAWDSHRGARHE